MLRPLISLLFFLTSALAYEVSIVASEFSRQICSGMWASESTFINVTFNPEAYGQLAMVIYEWTDAKYLGKITSVTDDSLPKTYVCTADAVATGFCTRDELGRFIMDLPSTVSLNSTSFWNARVKLPHDEPGANSTVTPSGKSLGTPSLWDNPAGNPKLSGADNYTTPWKRDTMNPSPSGLYSYSQPIQYLVRKTGYYCVAIVPMTVQHSLTPTEPVHPQYKGKVLFRNTFDGKLPATDYPKVNFYLIMFLLYSVFGGLWGWMCYQNLNELLPIQYYLSGLVGLLVIEMVANWGYYRYLNAHGKSTASTVFLIVVAILDAGRNSMSFFMLLVVSLGLSVVKESLGSRMIRCQILAGAHFIFGILYAVGIVELELESTTALVLLLFVIPLAFTLSGFLLWIMYALNATITQLRSRKQHYKLSMFEKLNRVLLGTVVVIAVFFVVSSFSFSGRLAEDYAANSWKSRWWLLDGWLALLYFVSFVAISYLWRPSPNNRRLAMSDELAQDEADAEDYDMEALEGRSRNRDEDDDNATLVGSRRGRDDLAEDSVVFEIGDEDMGSDDESKTPTKKRDSRLSGENTGLMSRDRDD
ncbi:lung seven transmembrane receptor-domain-containing protein [Mycena floridula]|nr:lung seven transmembrane receptor-domain-containing protein [Mycena floridula]